MLIALDYDDTFTADPGFWTLFIASAKNRGHEVVIATARFKNFENVQTLAQWIPNNVPIVFCNHNLKREECLKAGYRVDIWIDDTPESIGEALLIKGTAP